MNIKIEPRKPTDRGGYICMPLKKNVPEKHEGWYPAVCPICGMECWSDYARDLIARGQGAILLCTECALIEGAREAKGMISKAFFNACVKYVLISVLWMVLERIIYGKIQPRIVDDIIGLILFWYIFKSEI